MPGSFMRRVNDAIMPKGSAWEPEFDGSMDRFLDGCAENAQALLDDLKKLAYIRNPRRCPIELLPDLEREYGITPDDNLDEESRRNQVKVLRGSRDPCLVRRLQGYLSGSGFPLIVTPNGSQAVNPDTILGNDGYCLVNGTRFQFHGSYPQAGYMYAQDYPSTSSAGYHDTEQIVINEYSAGTDPRWWPFVFFIGGAVTRNPDGSIAAIARVTLPFNRLQELHRMILRIKPLHAWAAMCVRYA